MAPALSEPDRKPGYPSRSNGLAKPKDKRRPELAPPMEDHAMGLQNAESFLKDSQEVDRILGALDAGAEVDIMQVIKTMEGAGGLAADGSLLPSGDSGAEADAMFPLATFERDFLADVDVMQMCDDGPAGAAAREAAVRDRVADMQERLERRCDFLRRRLRIQQARGMGKHISEEVAGLFEHVHRALRKTPAEPERRGLSRPAVRALVKRLQASVALPRAQPEGLAPPAPRAPPGLAPAAGALRSQLALVERQLDSDATASSSGAESADETVPYTNQFQHPMPATKRALWKYTQERSSIASRWTWLQAQVQELEYRIRQHAELQRQVRAAKGVAVVGAGVSGPEPSGYSGPLPGEECARARPLARHTFRKRKLLQMHNLHTAATKAARPSTVRCICQWPLGGCAVCTGRAMPMHPLPHPSTLSMRERLALVDPAFHPVLSSIKDVSPSIHYSGMMKDPQWQQKSSRGSIKSLKGIPCKLPSAVKVISIPKPHPHPHPKKRKYNRIKRGRPSLASIELAQARRRASLQEMARDASPGPLPSGGSSPAPSPSDHHRFRVRERDRIRLNSSYDIDNIVIPHSIAANTKLEILQYKEILTPKWRTIESEEQPLSPNNGLVRKCSLPVLEEKESDNEDISDMSVLVRHERCEALERGKYLKKRKNSRRQNSRSSTVAPLTPSETPPHTPAAMIVDETSMNSESGTPNAVVISAPATPAPPTPPAPSLMDLPPCSVSLALLPPSVSDCLPSALLAPLPITTKRRVTDDIVEIVPPYSPRQFPLADDTYSKMLKAMPDNHPLSLADTAARRHPSPVPSGLLASDSESNSNPAFSLPHNSATEGLVSVPEVGSDSDDSYSVAPEEDPNDPEWNAAVSTDKLHR